MTKLSVNINKIATLRNARGGDIPNVAQAAIDCQKFGADGITIHPRPDERHIRYRDALDLKPVITTEFNIEGNPEKKFVDLVEKVIPTQITLVPDAHDAITSNAGWNCIENQAFLTEMVQHFQSLKIRVSIFVGTELENIEYAAKTGADRIELYTEPYAANFAKNPQKAIENFVSAANFAIKNGLNVNAGHDLNLQNLAFFAQNIPFLSEVSIGHALIADSLYTGLEKTIGEYKNKLRIKN
ncbi:MAG: pyridoxine 5'-phosphate synthase [Prevotellaceae bacterium]|jgi:pyridoxine 5-phosphate synthase|nr:pyridoxine 5'-phosphate synthase [Prevotellaceae bacterium]